tara:strand:+ start:647 stop:1270 length:624 start_codon:yes stop_codon:yes gene_type:complete
MIVQFKQQEGCSYAENGYVQNYCNDLFAQLVNQDYLAISTDINLQKLADKYMAKPVTLFCDGKVIDGLVVFIVVNFLDAECFNVKEALADNELKLEENLDMYLNNDMVEIYAEIIPSDCEFVIQKYLKEYTDFNKFYALLLEAEYNLAKAQLSQQQLFELLKYKQTKDEEVKQILLTQLVDQTGYKAAVLQFLANEISTKPKLNTVN